jgi:DNA recombination protein RmuC
VPDILPALLIGLLSLCAALLVLLLWKVSKIDMAPLAARVESAGGALERQERFIREEAARVREETGKEAREQRKEILEAFKSLSDSVARELQVFAKQQKEQADTFSLAQKDLLQSILNQIQYAGKVQKEQAEGFSATQKAQLESMLRQIQVAAGMQKEQTEAFSAAQKAQLESMSGTLQKLSETNEKKSEALRVTVEARLSAIQSDNAAQLEKMRMTVDEKLQGTLEKRLGDSFKQVSERLEMVHKGLGEMQTLATGVGDLKKVLTNVKTRGTWGEVQLGALLDQVLSPDQFAANVAVKGGGERVEYAIRLPGQGPEKDGAVWLPVDAKFPVEDYIRLVEAYDSGEADKVEAAGRQLEARVKLCAADISKKYISPPDTTDFAVLFLPVEGLFAEVLRRTGLAEAVQREHRVVIAGPTTLWSILNSLQMGFRTLAIQKRSSEVWNLLGAVKTEWSRYGDVLEAAQKKLHQAVETIEKAKARSRAVGRKLRDVQELPEEEARALLPPVTAGEGLEDGEEG